MQDENGIFEESFLSHIKIISCKEFFKSECDKIQLFLALLGAVEAAESGDFGNRLSCRGQNGFRHRSVF